MADVALGPELFGEGEEVRLYLISKVTDDKGDVVKRPRAHRGQVLHEVLDNGLSRHVHQRFRHGQCMGTQPASPASHGYDEVHVVPV